VDRVAVFPLGPVTVELLLTCADAASVQRAINNTVIVREREFIFSFLVSGSFMRRLICSEPKPSELFRATM
jgi:hypothetical protein